MRATPAQRGVEEVGSVRRLLRTTAVLIGATGATVGAAYGMLSQQGRWAHRDIMIPGWFPFRADGVYLSDGTGPYPPSTPAGEVLRFAVLGDSSAAGLGVDRPEQLPGVVLARGLAQRAGRAVQLDTLAICGCTSRRLSDSRCESSRGPSAWNWPGGSATRYAGQTACPCRCPMCWPANC